MTMNIVCLGGGTGLSEILRGLKEHDCNITAVVAVTDSGRSTGVLRKKFKIIAPGDLRNCIVALSESEKLIQELFQFRFSNTHDKENKPILDELEGMSFGNLFLTALTQIKGDMFSAIKEASKILKIKGRVLPSTLNNTHICAKLEDGTIKEEELNVREQNKSPIKEIYLKEKANAPKEVISAIKKADLIIIGPGSLYTSVIVHFLLPNLKRAFNESKAKKIYLCNMITQAGQTDNYDAYKHIKTIIKYAGKIDEVLINNKPIAKKLLKEYEKEGGFLVKVNKKEISKLKIKIVEKDIIKDEKTKREEWNKVSSIRHDPYKAAKEIFKIANYKKKLKAVILAAGNSTRLRPFSFNESKVLMEFLGKSLLAYHIEECIINNIKEIVIVGNKYNIKEIKKETKRYLNKAKINYVIQSEQKGPSNAILSARQFLKDCDFLLKYGDSISSKDEVKEIIKIYDKEMGKINKYYNKNEHKDNVDNDNEEIKAIITSREENKNLSEYGVIKFKNNKVVEILEKPKENFPSNKVFVGLCILDSESFFEGLKKDNFEKEVPPPQHILRLGKKAGYWITKAKRLDLGRVWNILEVNKLLIERFGTNIESINVSKSAKISKNSYIHKNAIIGENVKIEGYCSINGVINNNSIIKNSYIMGGSKIGKNCNIKASVIGKNNIIGDNFKTKINGKNIKIYVKGRYLNPSIKEAGLFTGSNVIIKDNLYSTPGKMVFPNKVIYQNIKQDKLIRAILFDADNTIYATKNVAKIADLEAMKIFAEESKLSVEEIYSIWQQMVKDIKNEKEPKKRTRKYSYSLLSKKIKIKKVNEAYDSFLKTLINSIKLVKGFEKIIPFVENYKKAVITEDILEITNLKLKKFNLNNFFESVITSDIIGEMKPSIEYYKHVFKKFNVEPNECLVIGDNFEKDLQIAKELGATTVCFNDNRADFSIKNYDEFINVLKII